MSKFKLRRLGLSDDPGQHRPTLHACLEAVLEQSECLADEVLSGIAAVTRSPKAADAPPRGDRPDAMARQALEILQQQAEAFRLAFASYVRQGVLGGEAASPQLRQAMRFDDFQFLDAEQLDASIEQAQSLQTVQLSVDDSLPMLNAMVSHLLGWSSVQAHLNPLRPEVFVVALRAALTDVLPQRPARSAVVHRVSGCLGVALKQLYRETTEWLRSQGVEPVYMTSTKATGLWNPTMAPDSTVARTMLTLDKLRRLLTGELDPNPQATDKLDFSATIPASLETLQDLKLVEPMMKRLAERAHQAAGAGAETTPALTPVDLLAPAPEVGQRRRLGEQLSREVVLLMLDNLQGDRRLLPPVRAGLVALEDVLVQLSRQDGRFFSERHHPARVFLDQVTHRSLAFASVEAPGFARFQEAFAQAVAALKTNPADAATFARLLRDMESAWSTEDSDRQRRASEAARGLLRAEQRNSLAQQIAQQLGDRLQGQSVPSFIAQFLREAWAQVVAEAQLHLADGTVDPGGYLAVVDDLVWSVQLRLTRNNRARLLHLMPDMLLTLRRGLTLISTPPDQISAFFDALLALHEQVFDGPPADPPAGTPAAGAQRPEGGGQPWVVAQEAEEAGYLNEADLQAALEARSLQAALAADRRFWRIESLATGAWVDLALGSNWVRAQLSWISPQRSLFMFTSGAGMTHSMSYKTLEKMKKVGLVRMVSERRVMDAALDGVAQTALANDLRQTPPKPSAD